MANDIDFWKMFAYSIRLLQWLEYIYDLPVLIPYALRNLTDFSGEFLDFYVLSYVHS